MKKCSSHFLIGLLVAAGSMHASPLQYNITLNGNDVIGIIGSFDYDASTLTNPFSQFDIEIDGVHFDFTSAANAWTGLSCGGSTGPQSVFNALIGDTGSACPASDGWVFSEEEKQFYLGLDMARNYQLVAQSYCSDGAVQFILDGTYVTTEANTNEIPEPSTYPMFLAGAGALWSWKRWRRNETANPG